MYFKKEQRFQAAVLQGQKRGESLFGRLLPENGRGVNRVGYTVSVKLGHAVVRNRVRRRLREIYRLNSPALSSGWDIVVVARSRCVGADYRKMDAAFLSACEKLSLTRGGVQ